MSYNASSSAPAASENQQRDESMIHVQHHILPHRQGQRQSSQRQRSATPSNTIHGEDTAFWWERFDALTTAAANALHIETTDLHPMQPRCSALRPFAPARMLARAPATGTEILNERVNNDYLDLMRTDPRSK